MEDKMAEIIQPDAFNERFTIYLNTVGNPVQRSLREMTAGEVGRTMDWHYREAMRLEAETRTFREIAEAAAAGTLDPATPADVRRCAFDGLGEAQAAAEKAARLWKLVETTLRAVHGADLPLGEALRRYWPGGRAA
jgi:hypothetical protein